MSFRNLLDQKVTLPNKCWPALRPRQANDARTLARYIKWASTAFVNAASRRLSEIGGDRLPSSQSNIPIPDLPPTLMDPTDMDQVVW